MAKIISIVNQKGGVGKTTTCVSLTAALAEQKKRVLLCDFDPQANSTSGMGVDKTVSKGVYEVLVSDIPAAEAVAHTRFGDVLPSNKALAGAGIELIGMENREYLLRDALETLRPQYDYIFIDCPPSLELLTLNALCASNSILVATFLRDMLIYAGINSACTILIFHILKLYNSLWEFASVSELVRITLGCFFSAVFYMVGMFMLHLTVPRSFPAIYMLILCLLCGALRLSYRCVRRTRAGLRSEGEKRTMLIGGGQAGAIALREFQTSPRSENKVVCIIDDSPNKVGSYLRGVKIVGGRSSIPAMAEKYDVDEIVLAIPSASRHEKLQILSYCHNTSCTLRTLPGICQLANGEVRIEQIREVDIEDLLGRETVKIDLDEVAAYITGKTVLVTGGGGSIGSELCRQAAAQRPKRLIIFDIYENNAYDIQMELRRTHPELDLVVLIGSVRDRERVMQVFDRYRPDLVCHAAAHKHVPLMETSPFEAIKNNVFGTYNVAQAADRFGTQRFILISTDKAVNPTNVMGASKRLCEMIVQMMNDRSATEYVAVRFGNVLGSAGSVIPLFRKQIRSGGPVTVTDKRVIRYFMTIPEAVQLIFQAGAYARGGEIFVLDMGEPVRIDDLAHNMIRLSGFEPDVDIPIVYTGLRPGEKLYEELLLSGEGMQKTKNDLIYIGHEIAFDPAAFEENLMLLRAIPESDEPALRAKLRELVPTFHAPDGQTLPQNAAVG